MSIEEMEIVRSDLFNDYLGVVGTGSAKEKELVKKLDLMDAILDAMEGYEAEEEADTATNWDEWMIDNAIDREREDRMDYEA